MDLRVSKNISVLSGTANLMSHNVHKPTNFTVLIKNGVQDGSDSQKEKFDSSTIFSNQKQCILINNNHNSSDSSNKECESKVDEDLTSLSWLHDNNLLQNLCKSTTKEDIEANVSDNNNLRTTSDNLSEDSLDDPTDKKLEIQKNSKTITLKVPYNPLVHVNTKPPYSFSCLIFMAIEESPKKALPVKDIYSWIIVHFPYFRHAPSGWKNSVRHNLSLNKCFCKVDKDQRQNIGKGSLWCVDDEFRPNLLQALKRAPLYPLSNQDDVKGDDINCSGKSTLLDDVSESCPHSDKAVTEQRRKRYLKLDTNIGIYQHSIKARKINESTSEVLSNKSSADHTYSASTHEENKKLQDSNKESQLPRLHIIYNNIINTNDGVILPMNFEKDLESEDSLGSISYDLNNASQPNKCVQSVIVDGRKLKVFVKEEEERSLEEGAQALLSLANISRFK